MNIITFYLRGDYWYNIKTTASRMIKIFLLMLVLSKHKKYFKSNFNLFWYQKLTSCFIQMKRRKHHYKKCVGRGFKPYTKGSLIYFGSSKHWGFLLIKALASFVTQVLVCWLARKMKRKGNYVMVKRAKPKRINLPNGRLFFARYERIRRERLLPNVTIKRSYEQRPAPSN